VPLKFKDGLPWVTITHQGLPYDYLLDTGSNAVVLPSSLMMFYKVKKVQNNALPTDRKSSKSVDLVSLVELFEFGELQFKDLEVFWESFRDEPLLGYPVFKDKIVTFDMEQGYVFFEE
jgi:hypothetical protein